MKVRELIGEAMVKDWEAALGVVVKRASDLRSGDKVVEGSGAVLTVSDVATSGGFVEIQFERYGVGPAPKARVRAKTMVRVQE